jgi:hypothetical protein
LEVGQRVGERVKIQVGAQQGAEERLVYGWLVNQKSLIYILIVVLAEGGNLEQASCGGYEEPSGRTLLNNKKTSFEKNSTGGHESITLGINDLSGRLVHAGRMSRHQIFYYQRNRETNGPGLESYTGRTPHTPHLLRHDGRMAPNLQPPR